MKVLDTLFSAVRARRWNPAWLAGLCVLASCWGVLALSLPALRLVDSYICCYGVLGSCALLCVCLLVLKRSCFRLLVLCFCGSALGLLLAFSAAFQLHVSVSHVEQSSLRAYVFTAVEDAQSNDYGTSCTAKFELGSGRTAKAKLYLPDDVDVRCFDKVHATCRLSAPTERNGERLWTKGIVATASLEHVRCEHATGVLGSIQALRMSSSQVLDQSAAHYPACRDGIILMKALLLADRDNLFSSDTYAVFKKVGLAHLVAVSGAHLVLVSGFFAALLQFFRIPKRIRLPLQYVFIACYVIFTGMPVSALRAAVMSVCSLSSFYAHRAKSSVNALVVCLLAMLALQPFLALSVSLALSAFASLGIVLLGRTFGNWVCAAFGGHGRTIAESVGVCLAASFATLPLSIPLFSQLPLISPVSNLLATVAFPCLVCLGIVALISSLFLLPGAGFLLKALAASAQVFVEACSYLAEIPFACIPATGNIVTMLIVAVLVTLALLIYQPTPKPFTARCFTAGLVASFVFMIGIAPLSCGVQIIALDVGQGDAILLRSANRAMLIDTGTSDAKLLSALARHKVHHLDALFISHPDDDHCGSLEALKALVPIERACVARSVLECDDSNCQALVSSIGDIPIVPLDKGDVISLACYTVRVLGPQDFVDAGGNADSLVLDIKVDFDQDERFEWRMFSAGDAEVDVLEDLAKSGALDDVDILKVSHHGSKNSLNQNILDNLEPEVALISVGKDNRYGHPTQACLDCLTEYGCVVYRTDECGDVVCNLGVDRLNISTQR